MRNRDSIYEAGPIYRDREVVRAFVPFAAAVLFTLTLGAVAAHLSGSVYPALIAGFGMAAVIRETGHDLAYEVRCYGNLVTACKQARERRDARLAAERAAA